MNPKNIPDNIKNILRSNELTMTQKMTAFMAFMPNLPDNNQQIFMDNLETGRKIKTLIDEKKITLNGFDENFELRVSHLTLP